MDNLTQRLPTDRRHPRLWFERLVIFNEPDEAHIVRTIPFHRGLNLVWAKEPAAGHARGTRAAGHGVGKTSLCLLLRFCLGDPSKAVAELRDELFGEFAQGGVLAVLYVDDALAIGIDLQEQIGQRIDLGITAAGIAHDAFFQMRKQMLRQDIV